MPVLRTVWRAVVSACAVLTVGLALVPAGASARERAHHHGRCATYGYTSLALNAGTATTLTSSPSAGGLGLSVAPVAPAYVANGDFNFPITNSPFNALATGDIDHSGGIAISGGGTTVDLTNFVISVTGASLTADVSVSSGGSTTSLGPVNIVTLDFGGAHIGLRFGELTVGPVAATLNDAALSDLGSVFGVSALGSTITSLPLGTATVHYRLF